MLIICVGLRARFNTHFTRRPDIWHSTSFIVHFHRRLPAHYLIEFGQMLIIRVGLRAWFNTHFTRGPDVWHSTCQQSLNVSSESCCQKPTLYSQFMRLLCMGTSAWISIKNVHLALYIEPSKTNNYQPRVGFASWKAWGRSPCVRLRFLLRPSCYSAINHGYPASWNLCLPDMKVKKWVARRSPSPAWASMDEASLPTMGMITQEAIGLAPVCMHFTNPVLALKYAF